MPYLVIFFWFISPLIQAEVIARVVADLSMVGSSNKIVIETFDDPQVPGVSCYLSQPESLGLSESIGMAEGGADIAINCSQTGSIILLDAVKNGSRNGEEVFQKRLSPLSKTLQVLRYYDKPRNALLYLSYSDKLVNGQSQHGLSIVVIKPWVNTP